MTSSNLYEKFVKRAPIRPGFFTSDDIEQSCRVTDQRSQGHDGQNCHFDRGADRQCRCIVIEEAVRRVAIILKFREDVTAAVKLTQCFHMVRVVIHHLGDAGIGPEGERLVTHFWRSHFLRLFQQKRRTSCSLLLPKTSTSNKTYTLLVCTITSSI